MSLISLFICLCLKWSLITSEKKTYFAVTMTQTWGRQQPFCPGLQIALSVCTNSESVFVLISIDALLRNVRPPDPLTRSEHDEPVTARGIYITMQRQKVTRLSNSSTNMILQSSVNSIIMSLHFFSQCLCFIVLFMNFVFVYSAVFIC